MGQCRCRQLLPCDYGETLDLNQEQFNNCLDNGTYLPQVEENVDLGFTRGVSSTTQFFP